MSSGSQSWEAEGEQHSPLQTVSEKLRSVRVATHLRLSQTVLVYGCCSSPLGLCDVAATPLRFQSLPGNWQLFIIELSAGGKPAKESCHFGEGE